MNESFYQLYKSLRDLVADFADKEVDDHVKQFIESTKYNCERQDREDNKYLVRWQNERFLLFRFHRGGLAESMETIQIIDSFEQLICIINEWWDSPLTKITIEPYIYDNRINWDTQLVLIHIKYSSFPVGYLNKKPDWKAPKEDELNVD